MESGFLGYDLKNQTALVYDSGDQLFSATNIGTAAKAIESIIKKPATTSNQFIYISSFTLSQNDILRSLEKTTSSSWTVTKASTAEGERDGLEKLAKGDFSGIRGLLARLMYGGDTGGNFTKGAQGTANKLLGLPVESLDESIKTITSNNTA